MLRKKGIIVIALAAMMSLAGAVSAMAQSAPGTAISPVSATTSSTGSVRLNPGQQQWYTFNSSQVTADATDAAIMIELAANPQGSANFAVWTLDGLNAFNAGDNDLGKPVGRGTLQTQKQSDGTTKNLYNGDLLWVGRSLGPTTYYVQVSSNFSDPATYSLMFNGKYISFPSGSPANQVLQLAAATGGAVQQTVQQTSAVTNNNNAALQAPVTLPATGPSAAPAGSRSDMALPFLGQTRTLTNGQTEWYSFQYPGHNSNGDQPTASIIMTANPPGSATFSVWTAQRLQAAANGDTTFGAPIGHGTLHPFTDGGVTYDRFGGRLQWSGQSAAAEQYLVQVQQTGSTPSTYSLQFSLR